MSRYFSTLGRLTNGEKKVGEARARELKLNQGRTPMVNPVKLRSEEMQGATAVTPVINLQMAAMLSNGGGTARKRDGDIEETIWTKLLAQKRPARASNSRSEKRGAGVYQRDDRKRYRRPKEREGKTKEMEQRLFPGRRCGLGILRKFGRSVRRASGTFWKQKCRFCLACSRSADLDLVLGK